MEPIDSNPPFSEKSNSIEYLSLINGRKIPILRTVLNIDAVNKNRSLINKALLEQHGIDIKSPQFVWRCYSKSQQKPISSDESPYDRSIKQLKETASDKPISNNQEVFVSDVTGAELTHLGFGSLLNNFYEQYVSTILMYDPTLIPDLGVNRLPMTDQGAALASKMLFDFKNSPKEGYKTLLDSLKNVIEIHWTK